MQQTVLITGASSGIGNATAERFAEAGWTVIATMRDPAKAGLLSARKGVVVARLDIEDPASIDEAVAQTVDCFRGIDVVVNDAGYGQYGVFEAVPRAKVMQQFAVNVFGPMDVIRAVLPSMRKRRRGVIINVSSGAGIFTLPMISLYCASKFALEGFSEALAYELLPLGIVTKLVEPHGGVNETDFNARAASDNAGAAAPEDYKPFIERSADAFARMSAARLISSADVAQVIYGAATDGTDRLRYLVDNDTRGSIKARAERPDQDYVDFIRNHFRDALAR